MASLPRLYPIADTALLAARGLALLDVVEAWLEAGVRWVQLRHKDHYGRQMFETAARMAVLCRSAGAQIIINDRADLAMVLGCGLHLGQDDLPPEPARRLLGAQAIVGFSTHNEMQLEAGERAPVDYLSLGPIFATASKHNPDPVVGLERLEAWRRLTTKPLVAIGGITRQRAAGVLRAGADSLAVISDLIPENATKQQLRERALEWIEAVGSMV